LSALPALNLTGLTLTRRAGLPLVLAASAAAPAALAGDQGCGSQKQDGCGAAHLY